MNRFFTLALMTTACSDSSLKVVNSAPEAEITYPTEGAEVLEAVEQTLYGWVADRDGPTEDLRVRWFQGADTLLCEDVVPDSSGDVFCTAAFEMDAVSVRLEVVDKRGGLGQDSVDFKMVPTDAPTAEILRPEGEFGFYVGQLITFEGLVADGEDEASTLTAAWESTIDGPLDTVEASPNPSGELLGFGELTEGEHGITLTVTDSTGKQATDSVVVTVGPPNTAPTCEITAPEMGQTFSSDATVSFAAVVDDVDVPADWLSVTWTSTLDGEIGTSTPSTAGLVSFLSDLLSAGTHTVTMTVSDDQGENCTDNVTVTIGSPPSANILAPEDDAVVQEGETVEFIGEANDSDDASDLLTVEWTSSEDGTLAAGLADADGNAGFSTATLTRGSHTVNFSVVDTTGQSAADEITITVNGQPTLLSVDISHTDERLTNRTALTCAATASDPEGDTPVLSYGWTNETSGATLDPGADDTTVTLTTTTASPGDSIVCTATATDSAGGATTGTDSVLVLNTAPSAPTVEITTTPPTSPIPSSKHLICNVVTPAMDPDGDPLTYSMEWFVDGEPAGPTLTDGDLTEFSYMSLRVSSALTTRGELWTCEVSASDGTESSAVASASATIANTRPGPPTVVITPEDPGPLDDLVCSIVEPSFDEDGDALTYSFSFFRVAVGSVPYTLSGASETDSLTVPAEVTHGDEWRCNVRPNDGFEDGDLGFANVTVNPTMDCGDGTIAIPITTCDQLQALADPITTGTVPEWAHLAEPYCLFNDIDCSDIEDFTSIHTFSGELSGLGHTISGFKTTDSGLFEQFSGAVYDLNMSEVQVESATGFSNHLGTLAAKMNNDVHIENVHITGVVSFSPTSGPETSKVGGLFGEYVGTGEVSIVESSFDGSVEGPGTAGGLFGRVLFTGDEGVLEVQGCSGSGTVIGRNAGGLIGSAAGVIEDSSFDGDVSAVLKAGGLISSFGYAGGLIGGDLRNSSTSGTVYSESGPAGGIVGEMSSADSTVEQSFSTASVSSEDGYAGGLVGQAAGASTIRDCYALGAVDGWDESWTGGLVGMAGLTTIENSYSAGPVSGIAARTGGLIGSHSGSIISNTYWDTESSGTDTSDGGEGRTTSEMTTEATFVDWDFTDTWTIDEGTSYPCLQWQGEDCPVP